MKIISPKALIYPAILLISLLIPALLDAAVLFKTPLAVGIDGYYYVLQVNSLHANGHLYFPNQSPLVLYFFSLLAIVFGDTIFAIKIGAILLHSLLCVGIFSFILTVTRNFWWALTGILIAAFSGLHFYLIGEFLNQSGAVMFLIWTFFAIAKFFKTCNKLYLFLSLLLFTGAALSHRSAIFLALLVLFTSLLAYLCAVKNPRNRIIGLAVFIVAFVFLLLLAIQPFYLLPQWLTAELSRYPKLPGTVALFENLMLLAVVLGALFLTITKTEFRNAKIKMLCLLSGVFFILLVNLNPFLEHSTGFLNITGRLDCLAYIVAALTVPLLLSLCWDSAKTVSAVLAVVFTSLLIAGFFRPLPPAMRDDHLGVRKKLLEYLSTVKHTLCPNPLIVAAHGEQFLVTAAIGVPSQQEPPDLNTYECVYWLLRDPIEYDDPGKKPTQYILLPDEEFTNMTVSTSSDEVKRWIYLNPHLRKILKK